MKNLSNLKETVSPRALNEIGGEAGNGTGISVMEQFSLLMENTTVRYSSLFAGASLLMSSVAAAVVLTIEPDADPKKKTVRAAVQIEEEEEMPKPNFPNLAEQIMERTHARFKDKVSDIPPGLRAPVVLEEESPRTAPKSPVISPVPVASNAPVDSKKSNTGTPTEESAYLSTTPDGQYVYS